MPVRVQLHHHTTRRFDVPTSLSALTRSADPLVLANLRMRDWIDVIEATDGGRPALLTDEFESHGPVRWLSQSPDPFG
jgi:hypothetical protein